jgi:hypothetical protein
MQTPAKFSKDFKQGAYKTKMPKSSKSSELNARQKVAMNMLSKNVT